MFRVSSRSRRLALASVIATSLSSAALGAPQEAPSSLDEALRAAARQTGREIIYPADATKGRQAPFLAPNTPPEDAIRTLLRGTGLEPEFRADVIVLRQAGSPAAISSENQPGEAATVVVTATRIRGEAAASPVISASRRDIEIAGVPDLGEFARRLPQNFGGGQNPGVGGGGSQGGSNNINASSNINLRGLGEDATLTLVNGHRVAYDGLNQGIDISAFPIASVERIEVVVDSASALHGSDAIGGVVNVILRSDYDGLLTTARVGTTFDGGDEQQEFSAVGGSKWNSGGFMLAGQFSRNGDIKASERALTATLDPTDVLFPARHQVGAVANGHQRIGAVTLGVDAQYSHRVADFANAFLTSGGVTANGLVVRPTNDFYAISPSLRFGLPGTWSATLVATQSSSHSDLLSRRFSQSAETRLSLRYHNGLKAAEAGAEGPLVALPGGDARLALGGGVRSLDLSVRNASTVAGVTRTTADYRGERTVLFGYGELSIPLFGPGNRRNGVERLRLDAAARYENYRGLANILSPKVGLIYSPVGGVTLKGTWGRSFKAPTLQQQNQIRQNALLPSAFFVGAPAGGTILLLAGGGNALRPERAQSWSGTLEVSPASGLTISASYFDIRYRDRVAAPIPSIVTALSDPRYAGLVTLHPTATQLASVVATLPTGITNQTGRPYDPASVTAIVNSGLANVAQQRARGADLSLSYRAALNDGQRVAVTGTVSYLESDQTLLAGQAPTQKAGTIFDPPNWHGQLSATWESNGVTVGGFANYLGENLDDRFTPQGKVGSFATFDLSLRARSPGARGVLRGVEAGITILNVFDEKPNRIPNLDPTDPPYDSTNSSIFGRAISLSLSKAW